MKDGAINSQGTYQELMGKGGAFADFINEHSSLQTKRKKEDAPRVAAAGGNIYTWGNQMENKYIIIFLFKNIIFFSIININK